MIDKDEIFHMRKPGRNIQCRTCKRKLPTIEVAGEKVERFNFGTCSAFENKPPEVLLKGEPCELYSPEE